MNRFFTLITLLSIQLCFAQSNTEVFLFDLNAKNGVFELSNIKNISNNDGYDNQPSFIDYNTILYAGTRNGQTDIVKYNINYDSKIYVNHTEGSEYSPLKIPGQRAVSAIRLEKNGDQKLYKYNLRNGESEVLIDDIVIGYHVWHNNHILLSSVLEDNSLSLYISNLKTQTHKKLASNIGRSLHKIPGSSLISFISKTNPNAWEIKSVDPKNGRIKSIAKTLPNAEDMCWLASGDILMGKDDKLYTFSPKSSSKWKEVLSLQPYQISKISRLATSPDGVKLALVGKGGKKEPETNTDTQSDNTAVSDPGAIVQKHIAPYNEGKLDDFANAFSENVVVSRFPDKLMYEGRETLKQNYQRFFDNNNNLGVSVDKRIVFKHYVVDEEIYTVNHYTGRQATIYTTSNDKGIETMTFIANDNTTSNPEIIVNKQLEAYNKRDIDAFMATYTDDIKLYSYPNKLTTEGQNAMRQSYKGWFDRTPDLKAAIKQRIIIGNKVIDKEEVTANGQTFSAIAIYEVHDGKISKVTFIQ